MDTLDIVLVNIVSFLSGTLSGLYIGYKWRIGCLNPPKEITGTPTIQGMSHSSSVTFPVNEPQMVVASAPPSNQISNKEIIIRT